MIDRRDTLEYWVTKNNWEEKMNDSKTVRKYLISTIQFIHELTEEKVSIIGLPFAEKEGKFVFDGMTLSFLLFPKDKVQIGCHLIPSRYDSLLVITKNGSYQIPKAHVSLSGEIGNKVDVRCHVRFDELSGLEWNKKKTYYYRFLIPIEKDDWLPLIKRSLFYRDCPGYDFEPNQSLITIDFGEKLIHAFTTGIKGYQYLVIESRFPCTYNEMLDYTYAVSLSLGLVTMIAPFDYAFIIASETLDFEGQIIGSLIRLRPTIKSQYCFITPHLKSLYESLKDKVDYDAFRPYCDKDGNLLKDRLDPMPEQEFAGLVSMLHRSKDLARAAMMLLVASDDIEYLGPLYSVVLETICSALVKDETGTYMESKDWKSVLSELKKTLSDFCEEHSITDEHKDVMIKKLDGFNSQTNGDKLTAPFEQIGYKLSGPEEKVIKERNRFLHGKIHECLSNESYKQSKLFYICMELRKLCGLLLFRHAGYKGPILNNAVALGLEEAIENEEPLFITYDEEAAKELVEKRKKEKQKEEEKKKKQNQDKNNTRNQGKEKAPQPTEKPEASV